ncbi:MAG TPA: metal ABC transporter permease [Gammaproteobacteria bacterium]
MDNTLIDIGIILPALLAGILVLATHVPLGMVVLQRGIIFIDLAIAQIAGVGVILAHSLFHEPDNYIIQITAALSAVAGAIFLRWTEHHWPDIQEAIIGVVFVFSASAGLLLLANNPQGGEHLKDLLAGQILWVSYEQIISTGILFSIILVLWFAYRKMQSGILFYVLFAIAVTSSVQLVGVYLVFSSLIIPALAVWRHPSYKHRLWLAYACGVGGYVIGLVLSALADWPSGPTIVICLALVALIFWHSIQFTLARSR